MFIAKKSIKYLEKKFERKKKLGVLKGNRTHDPLCSQKKMKRLKKKLHGKHTELLGILQIDVQ